MINKVAELNNNLKNIGIETGNVENIKVNDRATKRMGLCKKFGNGFIIEISKFILSDNIKLTNVIYHELLHTVEGCFNHGNKWKMLANKVNRHYNTNINRTETINQEMKQEIIKKAKYKVTCQGCGLQFLRQKKSKLITNSNGYLCGKCGGKLSIDKLKTV